MTAEAKSHGVRSDPRAVAREWSPLTSAKRLLSNQTAIVWTIVLICLPLSRLVSPNFPSLVQVQSVLILSLFLVTIAFGQGLIILTGGIDLSLASVVALGAYATGLLSGRGVPVLAAVAIALALSGIVGLVSGLLVAHAKFPAFIVTLATGTILASALLGFSRGAPAQQSPEALSAVFGARATAFGLPTPIIVLAVVVALGLLIQNRSSLGLRAYALGNSEPAARIAGLPTTRTLVSVYAIAGVAYGLAGVMLLGYSSGADLNIGAGWLLPSITAVVVGGSSIRGGAGSFMGTVGGAVLLTLLSIDISAAGFAEGYKQIFYGGIILVALLGTRLGRQAR